MSSLQDMSSSLFLVIGMTRPNKGLSILVVPIVFHKVLFCIQLNTTIH